MRLSAANYQNLLSLATIRSRARESQDKLVNPFLVDQKDKKSPSLFDRSRSDESDDNRLIRFAGRGDKRLAMAADLSLAVSSLYPISSGDPSESAWTVGEEPQLEQINQLRGAIKEIADSYLRVTPNATSDELKSEIDAQFGEGVSDILSPELVEDRNGKSSFVISQIKWDDLTVDEQAVIGRAIDTAESQFSEVTQGEILEGNDIDVILERLESELGYLSKSFLGKLANDLKSGEESAESVIQKFESNIQNVLELNNHQMANLSSRLGSLRDRLKLVDQSFSQDLSIDDLKITVFSGRFRSAVSPEDISNVAELSANELFLSK